MGLPIGGPARASAVSHSTIQGRNRTTMDLNLFQLAMPLGLAIAALGSGIGLGMAVSSAMQAIGRQPEASGKIMLSMIIGCALIEALTIYAFVAIFFIK